MNTDWFNGNIKGEYIKAVKYTLLFAFAIGFAVALLFVFMGVFYENISDYVGRIIICALGGGIGLIDIIMFILSIWSIKNYPKHKRLANFFIKKDFFNDINKYN